MLHSTSLDEIDTILFLYHTNLKCIKYQKP